MMRAEFTAPATCHRSSHKVHHSSKKSPVTGHQKPRSYQRGIIWVNMWVIWAIWHLFDASRQAWTSMADWGTQSRWEALAVSAVIAAAICMLSQHRWTGAVWFGGHVKRGQICSAPHTTSSQLSVLYSNTQSHSLTFCGNYIIRDTTWWPQSVKDWPSMHELYLSSQQLVCDTKNKDWLLLGGRKQNPEKKCLHL